jgi:sigma-E factor negative regulatory protein RseC
MEEKFIDAVSSPPDTAFKVGDAVTLVMEERLGWLAIFYGFVLPLIVMVAVLIMVSAGGGSETEAALLGIGSLLPYYLLLYLFRQKIEKDFIFRAERKN